MTDEQIKEYFEKLNNNIKEYGYHVTNILESDSPGFCYSTGIYQTYKIPEIFISSLPKGLCSEIIENYVEAFKDGKEISLNEKLNFLTDRFPVYLIDVPITNLKEYVLSSIKIYGDKEFKYLQVIYPDIEGIFPNEAGYDYDQDIMGALKK
ncbi:DUF4262 domain-containing protein [Rufibacter tibetensis]|uniref:DUF4262 domain-containing protein n=1 Tax=Rufibacter tibetensis TaxID=512763 RepID=A0A0P0D1L4_9BACT|nr:DUF4262 domain-containing protein [Rufibacter tibetensis]ALJ00743.1 hypothetical protein DC20_19355 [Rufibacter tibetensis]